MNRRERSMKIVNYIDAHCSNMHSSSEDDDFKHNRTIKPTTAWKTKPRSCKVKKKTITQPILSPKTKKINEMFDKIKDNVVNDEKITFVKKKSAEKDLSPDNLTSESEDGDFRKKKNQVQKRISSSSLESSATKRRRLMNRVNYSKFYSPEDEDETTQKSKTVKQAKPRSRKTNKMPKFNLIDERMRAAQQETLETSFVKDTVDTNNLEEPEPALQQAPVLEDMPPDKPNDDEFAMAEFVTEMRSYQLQTSPVIPITRMSTKESARSNLCVKRMSSEESIHKSIAYAESNKSNPKVVLERLPTKEIESKLDPMGSPKSKVLSVVLTRISSEEIEKYKSSLTLKVVLERISPDDINKSLPMPESKYVVDTGENPKEYTTTQTKKRRTRQTSKPTETKTPVNSVKRKIKPNISPVKLSFDIVDLAIDAADDRVTRALKTRPSTKTKHSHVTNIDKEPLKTVGIKSPVPKPQTSKKDQTFIQSSQETGKSSAKAPASGDRSDVNRSIPSVEDWLQRNAAPSSPRAGKYDSNAYNRYIITLITKIHLSENIFFLRIS